MKYLKKFNTHSEYEAYVNSDEYITPNVSLCEQEDEVHITPWVETRVVTIYNVTDISSPTKIGYKETAIHNFSKIEIDGVELPSVVSAYTFSTTGEHTVKYTLANPTRIDDYAFQECTSLTSITIPNSVTSIYNGVFGACNGLTSITIPSSVTILGGSAFYQCYNLIKADFASIENLCYIQMSNTYSNPLNYAQHLFINGREVSNVIIPDSVQYVSQYAFRKCISLISVIIGNGVVNIGDEAFRICTSLTSATIGSGVTSISHNAFQNCSSLNSITCLATTPPTLGVYVFNDTNDCPIYVPSQSVQAYQEAENWTAYASRIQAITS